MADAGDLKSPAARRPGSIPGSGKSIKYNSYGLFAMLPRRAENADESGPAGALPRRRGSSEVPMRVRAETNSSRRIRLRR